MTVTEFLRTQVPFLAGLNEDQAHALASATQQVKFNKGQTVLFKGVTVDGLHVVAVGKVSVHVKLGKSGPPTVVAALGPGEVFGETSIMEMSTAGATIKADEDDTLIFVIPQDAFRCILTENAEFHARAHALIAARKQGNAAAKQPAPPAS